MAKKLSKSKSIPPSNEMTLFGSMETFDNALSELPKPKPQIPKEHESQKVMLEHSKAKVKLLETYLYSYLPIISNNNYLEKIRIYDLFCGEGLYENGGEGSPLAILRQINLLNNSDHAKRKRLSSPLPPFDCVFNDKSVEKVEKLKIVIQEGGHHNPVFGKVIYSNQDYQVMLDDLFDLLPTLKNQKVFIFIDPYGYKEVKASQIQKLMQTKQVEVLMWLPIQHMYRFSENGTPEALHDFINEVTEVEKWSPSDNVWKFIEQLNQGFGQLLGESFYTDYFFIEKDPKTVFCLFFFSPHIRGFERMIIAKWKMDENEGKGWNYDEKQLNVFSDIKTNELADKLETFLKTEKRFNGDVYEFTLRQKHPPTHAIDIFRTWQKNKKLDVFLTDDSIARRNAFYISYDYWNHRIDNRKAYFKIQ